MQIASRSFGPNATGRRCTPPSRKGLGSKLIERGLPNADIDWRFPPDGVVCVIELPLTARKATNGAAPPDPAL